MIYLVAVCPVVCVSAKICIFQAVSCQHEKCLTTAVCFSHLFCCCCETKHSFQVQETVDRVGQMPATSCVNVELSKETLDTMLDGLGKIREQLSSVAK